MRTGRLPLRSAPDQRYFRHPFSCGLLWRSFLLLTWGVAVWDINLAGGAGLRVSYSFASGARRGVGGQSPKTYFSCASRSSFVISISGIANAILAERENSGGSFCERLKAGCHCRGPNAREAREKIFDQMTPGNQAKCHGHSAAELRDT